jgi:aminomethyltransferase
MVPAGDQRPETETLPETEAGTTLLTTPLDALHRAHGARMVPFAGYAMPVQYPTGVIGEHQHCRAAAALFDVSHMGQCWITGAGGDAALENLMPGDIIGLAPMRQRYSLLMDPGGGILDDLMVARIDAERLFMVTNASRKGSDAAYISANLPAANHLLPIRDRALLALQGPQAAAVLARHAPSLAALPFMGFAVAEIAGSTCYVSRSGYTGEDGYEISVPGNAAEALATALIAAPEVKLAGLGARDSLRLEAGLCLYGSDIDKTTTPLEAGLGFAIAKRRRLAWDFVGGAALWAQHDQGPKRRRVGLRLEGRAPARAGAVILAADGAEIGSVTSGGFSPSLGAPIAMGYVGRDHAADGTALAILVRDKKLPARVVPMPFIPHNYKR